MPGLAAASSRLKEAVGYLWWFYTPFRTLSAKGIYELVSTKAFSEKGLYLNLGYWEHAATIDEACEALVHRVAETAVIGPADRVVDVGFGFADQDMYWMEVFRPAQIVGLNITPSQTVLARRRVAERGMADRIELLEASATAMPLADGSFDAVLGVECAFHFETREKFFAEAFRVLRPGGRLVLADVIRMPPAPDAVSRLSQDFAWNFFCMKYSVPKENSDTRETYSRKLGESGFRDVAIESIREQVYPGLHRFMASDPSMLRRFHPLARLPYRLSLRFKAERVYQAYDYVIASAVKPGL